MGASTVKEGKEAEGKAGHQRPEAYAGGVEVLGWAEAGSTLGEVSLPPGEPGPDLEPHELFSLSVASDPRRGGLVPVRHPFGLLILPKEGYIFLQVFLYHI